MVAGQGMGPFPGSWQHTDTHCAAPVWLIVTTAVEVSLGPLPAFVPEEAAPPSGSTPNHGVGPISKLRLVGEATIVAMLPGANSEAVTVALVEAVPPLISTAHQLWKLFTVSVPGAGAASDGGAPYPVLP